MKERFTARIATPYCKRIQDRSCIACDKCYKGMAEKNGEFAQQCTIYFDDLRVTLEHNYGVTVVLGTHSY